MTGDVTEVASEVTCSTGNQVLVVGVEVVGTGSDDTYDYNQSTIKICIKQTIIYVDGGGGVSKHEALGFCPPWILSAWILSYGFLSSGILS